MEPLNDLTILLALFPEKTWNYQDLTMNSNISLDFIESHALPLDKKTTKDFKKIPWEYHLLVNNPNLTIQYIDKHYDKRWKHIYASIRSVFVNREFFNNLSAKTMINNKDFSFDSVISINPNITWDIVRNNSDIKWNYDPLSANANITMEIIKAHPEIKWNYRFISRNPNITWEMVKNNIGEEWDWDDLSEMIPISIILNNINNNWDWRNVFGYNPSVTLESIIDKPFLKEYYENLLANPGITWENIQTHPELLKLLNDFPNYSLPELSKNPNLNWKIIYTNTNIEWDFHRLSQNSFGYRSYSWAEFLGDREVEDSVKLKVLDDNLRLSDRDQSLILAIYNPNDPNYNKLVGYYFAENYPNLNFDLEFDPSLPVEKNIQFLEQFVVDETRKEVESSQLFKQAKERFGEREAYKEI